MAIETVLVPKTQWVDLVLRMDIPPQRKAVAFALSSFANPDGSRVFPGQGKVADMAGLHETNARKHIRALVVAGMLTVVRRGGGRGGATNSYRLSRPLDITALPLWLDPDMNRVGAEGPAVEEYRASAPGEGPVNNSEYRALPLAVSVDNFPQTPVDNSETPGAGALHFSGPAGETPSVLTRNTERFGQEYRALALPDPPKTTPLPPQHPAGSPNATTSLALVPPLQDHDEDDEEPPDEPTPPGTPTAAEFEAGRDRLATIPLAAWDRLRRQAEAELLAAGGLLTRQAVAERTTELATRHANGAA